MPAKLSWHNEICPPKPTSGISDSATIPSGKIRPNEPIRRRERRHQDNATSTTTLAKARSADRRHRKNSQSGSRTLESGFGKTSRTRNSSTADRDARRAGIDQEEAEEIAVGEADDDRRERARQARSRPKIAAYALTMSRLRMVRRADVGAIDAADAASPVPSAHASIETRWSGAVQRGQRWIVDRCAHCDTPPNVCEHESQADRNRIATPMVMA
jgi:hypothetical protein